MKLTIANLYFWSTLPPQYCIKEFFIHRFIEYRNRANLMRGSIPDIYRILGKYSMLHFVHRYEADGVFVSKYTWKRIVRENMKQHRETEWRSKTETSESAKNIMKITLMNQEYLFWKVSREYPKYFPFIQRAVRMLGLMFTGRWIRSCHLCNEVIYYPTEHLLFFCRKTNEFRESL